MGVKRRSALVMALTALAAPAILGGCVTPVTDRGTTRVRRFGLAIDPWQVDEWAAEVGAAPNLVMGFEAWHRNRRLDHHLAEVKRQGIDAYMLTWEPWRTVDAAEGKEAQYREQPEYRNAVIARGDLDDYLRSMAESLAGSGLSIYLRYAHEMNGDWYPWSRDPENYVLAWRRVVDIFREVGAENTRHVFSLNPSLYAKDERWLSNARRYWPGAEYVDLLGTTMINFGGRQDYPVDRFVERFNLMRGAFDLPMIITEMNTAVTGRVKWLADLRTWLDTDGADWVEGVVLSQGASRGAVQLGARVGGLDWNVRTDPETRPVIRGMINDLVGARG